MTESILSLSEFKADGSRLLDRMRDEPTTLVLTQNGRARAVVEDYEQHRARQRALLMLTRLRLFDPGFCHCWVILALGGAVSA